MADLFDRILFLKESSIFSKVTTDDLRYIAQALEEDVFFANERVFDINDQGDHLYIVTEGKIGISIDPDPTKKEFIAFIGQGEAFGEMNLVDDLPRSATHNTRYCFRRRWQDRHPVYIFQSLFLSPWKHIQLNE